MNQHGYSFWQPKQIYLQLISSLLLSIKLTYDFQYFEDFKARFSDRGTILFNAQWPLKIFSCTTKFFRDQITSLSWTSLTSKKLLWRKIEGKKKKWWPTLTKKVTLHGYSWIKSEEARKYLLAVMSAKFCIQYLAKANFNGLGWNFFSLSCV